MNNPQEIFKQWEEKLRFDLSPTTLVRYMQTIKSFVRFTNKTKGFTRQDVENYLSNLRNQGYSESYCYFCFAALKKFHKKFFKWDFGDKEAPSPSEPKRPIVTQEQVEKMINLAIKNPMDYAIICLYAYTGMRRSEILNLKRSDYQKPKLRIETRKRGNTRYLKLDSRTTNALEEYIKTIDKKQDILFPLSVNELSNLFRKYADKVGIPKGVGLHSIRRAVVTWLHNAGMSTMNIQKYMGWKSATMPSIYVQLNDEILNEEVLDKHPLAKNE